MSIWERNLHGLEIHSIDSSTEIYSDFNVGRYANHHLYKQELLTVDSSQRLDTRRPKKIKELKILGASRSS